MTGEVSVVPRRVRCPGCGKSASYAADNPSRPFCSPRCRSADLGAWASEGYRVASSAPDDEDDARPVTGPAH